MKYFALGLLTVFVIIVLVGCAKKVKPFVAKTEEEKNVAAAFQTSHPDHVIVDIKPRGEQIKVDATETEPATSIQIYAVSFVSATDKKQEVKSSPVFYDTVKKTVGRPPLPTKPKNRPMPPGK